MKSISEQVEIVLNDRGWSHGQAMGLNGELCLLRASWKALSVMIVLDGEPSAFWLRAMNAAAYTLFPERITEKPHSLTPCGQVSDHPDTTREDISLLLKHAEGNYDDRSSADLSGRDL